MKAKLRKEQRERMKTSISVFQNTSSDNKSQENNNQFDKKKKSRFRSAEIPNGLFPSENIKNIQNLSKIPSTKNIIKESSKTINRTVLNPINKEELRVQELSRIATMFNFEVDKEKSVVKIQENDEYYDMREQIKQLEIDLKNAESEYDNLINEYEKKNQDERQEIAKLENELKKQVDNDVEKIKKDNIILARDINILDKKVDSLSILFKKEQYDMNLATIEMDNIIRKLKGEIYFVDDLKMRLKNLTTKDIPQELVDSINYVLKEDIAAQYKHTPTHSNIASFRSRTGTIPNAEILDISSLDSKQSEKKLFI